MFSIVYSWVRLLSLVSLLGRRQDYQLATNVRQATVVRHYHLSRFELEYSPYLWRSTEEVLYWQAQPKFPRDYLLFLLNVKTRKRRLIRQIPSGNRPPVGPRLSPDRQWILLPSAGAGGEELRKLFSRRRVVLPESVTSNTRGADLIDWASDSRHWVLVGWKRFFGFNPTYGTIPMQVFIGDRLHPRSIRRIDVARESPLNTGWPEILRIPSPDRLIVWVGDPGDDPAPRREVMLWELDLTHDAGVRRQWKVSLPYESYVNRIAFSPDGTRLLWQLSKTPLQNNRVQGRTPGSLWFSRPDGKEMTELRGVTVFPSPWLPDVQWLPNGKQISILVEKDLRIYSAP